MKKIIKVIFMGLLVVVLILSIGILIFLKTFDFNRLKPQIITAGQNALGRSLDFARLDLKLSFKNGVQLRIADINIGEHPDFGKGNFLTAEEINLGISLKDFILKRQIRVLGVECKSPQIVIIRLKDGRINAQAFGVAEQDKSQDVVPLPQKPSGDVVSSTAMGLPAVFANRINIDNGSVTYIDYSFEPKLSLIFNRITFGAENFSLTDSFPITLQAAFVSDVQNISAQGRGELDMNHLSFLLKNIKAKLDLSTFSMETLRRLIPQLEGVPLPEVKSGMLSASVDLFEAGPQGLMALRGKGTLTNGSMKIKELAVPIEPIEANFTMNESVVTITNASVSLGKGKIELSGDISDYMLKQEYSVKASIKGIDLNECIDQSGYTVKVKGLVSGNINLKGQGFESNTVLSRLNGNGYIEIKEGQLIDINVLKVVLDKLSFVPNLAAVLEAGLPDRFKDSLRKKDTAVTGFNATVAISNGLLVIQPMKIEAESFLFQGDGSVGFDQSYSFDGSFMIPQDLSSRMITAVPQMEYLLDEAKQIRFPLKVSGKGSAVSFIPDVKEMGVAAIKQKGRQELERVLENVFDKESPDQEDVQTDSASPEQPQSGADKGSGKKQLIDAVIGTIFKDTPKE